MKDSAERFVSRIEQRIMLVFISFGLFVIGGLAILGAFMFYLIEYQGFSNTLALLSAGVLLIILGMFIKLALKGGK